jgi:hypothetical protein
VNSIANVGEIEKGTNRIFLGYAAKNPDPVAVTPWDFEYAVAPQMHESPLRLDRLTSNFARVFNLRVRSVDNMISGFGLLEGNFMKSRLYEKLNELPAWVNIAVFPHYSIDRVKPEQSERVLVTVKLKGIWPIWHRFRC